jgi:diguanylate cyclase (GGDEF)-like protein
MMDIDHFKDYNDTFGHIPGDNILKVLAQLLETNVREIDFVARYGGDEFCILLPETDADDAVHQAERIRELVNKYPFEGQGGIPGGKLTVSVGVAIYPEDAQSKVKIVEHADKALYVAKKTGGNCVVRYDQNLEKTEIIQV